MLIISSEQMQELKNYALRNFENEMVAHCFDFSPKLCSLLQEEQVRIVVRLAIARARNRGFTLRGPIQTYIDMMFLFGSFFDVDPQHHWCHEPIKEDQNADQMERAEELYFKTSEYIEKVDGPEHVYTWEALRKLGALSQNPHAFQSEDFVAEMVFQMQSAYPQKGRFIGEKALRRLIQEGIDEAQRHQFFELKQIALIIVLMFAFGWGCTRDPLYPWIERTLHHKKIISPEERAKRLETKSMTWLNRVLASRAQ